MSDSILKKNVIALTGGIATGKTTVARFLSANGWKVIDADRLAREVLAPKTTGWAQVVDTFGIGILTPQGSLDRGQLGKIIFADKEQRKKLEAITHPLIRALLLKEVQLLPPNPSAVIFYEASLIFETKSQDQFKEVWVTACAPQSQVQRLMSRNQWSEVQAQEVIKSQWPLDKKIKQADHVIWTDLAPEIYLPGLLTYLKSRHLGPFPP